MTVEDPVEIVNPDITQIEVDDKANRSFATVLRSLLRQDPDIILVGEIRDQETAQIAIRASLTGHLVLATLHANDSINAITRLRDIGLSDALISATSNAFLSQKLVRTLCQHCKIERKLTNEQRDNYGLKTNVIYKNNENGCEHCKNGYSSGREAIIEVLAFDDELKSSIADGASEFEIKKMLKRKKFRNLWKNVIAKVEEGRISIEEAEEFVTKDAIMNKHTEDFIEKRIIYYPNREIEIKMNNGETGYLYDISNSRMAIVFKKATLFSMNNEYGFNIANEEMVLIPKSYAKFSKDENSIIIIGAYKGNSKFITELLSE
jgi:hypothetical protein